MLVSTFRAARLAILFLVPILTAVLWLPAFYSPFQPELSVMPMPFFKVVMLIFSWPSWLLNVIAIGFISAQAIYLNTIINNNEVLYKDTNLPALVYPLVISFTPQLLWLHPILFANFFILFTLNRIYSTYKHPNPLNRFFDIGFLIALASLFYFPAIFLILLVFAGLTIIRPFVWREWVASLIGLLLPYFFISIYYFWNDTLDYLWLKVIPSQISHTLILHDFYSYVDKTGIATTGLLVVLALMRLRANFTKNAIRTRDYQKVLTYFLLITILIYILTEDNYSYSIAITAIPVAVLVAYYFLTLRKKWVYEGIFYTWVVTIILSLIKVI
jgi:hypothetical protein